jgi:hypothetical protein
MRVPYVPTSLVRGALYASAAATLFSPPLGASTLEDKLLVNAPAVVPYQAQPIASGYSRNPAQGYDVHQDGFRLYIPSWITAHQAPAHEFGPNLFGLSYITPDSRNDRIVSRDDLTANEKLEVDFHEVLENLFHHFLPEYHTENNVRKTVRSVLGERAQLHKRIGWANY